MRRLLAATFAALLLVPVSSTAAGQGQWLPNDEVALVTLDPSGLPTSATLISRISSSAGPVRTVEDPASTTNLSYRDRPGAPPTTATGVLVEVGGSTGTTTLTQALFDKPLPVALHARYEVDGRVVDPELVPGSTGRISITYTATNTTAEQQTITATDAAGITRSQTLPVFAPFAGTLVVTVPAGMTVIEAPGAASATDADGATVLRFDLLLAPPAGDFTSDAVVLLQAPDGAATPAVVMAVAPVTGQQNPALGFAGELLGTSNSGSRQLAEGLTALDDGAAALAAGSATLAAGASQLASGQQSLAQGLAAGAEGADAAAAGSAALADGLSSLSAGLQTLSGPQGLPAAVAAAGQLRVGAGLLADLVGSSADGPFSPQVVPPSQGWPPGLPPWPPTSENLPQWAAAIAALPGLLQSLSFAPDGNPRDGVCRLDADGDGLLDTGITDIDCVPTLVQSLRLLTAAAAAAGSVAAEIPGLLAGAGRDLAGASGSTTAASADAAAAAAGAGRLTAELCGVDALISPEQCSQLADVAEQAAAAAAAAAAAGTSIGTASASLAGAGVRAAGLAVGLPALALLAEGTTALAEQVGDGLRSQDPASPGLVEGLAALQEALGAAAAASSQLAAGAVAAQAGAADLAAASAELAAGVSDAAAGATALAAGADEISSGTLGLTDAAQRLRAEGTSAALASVIAASQDAALAEAYLDAVADRARDALPYGAPEGAVGNAAYLLQMPATYADGSARIWGLAAMLALISAGFALALLRRRE
jgi:putative membrane protein